MNAGPDPEGDRLSEEVLASERELETSGDLAGEGPLAARFIAQFRRESVRKRLLAPLGVDTLILVTNLATGIIIARGLGAAGRGELTATLLVSQMAAWCFSMGGSEAISYHQSRHPQDASRLITSWLVTTVGLSLFALAAAELLLPALFAAQTSDALDLARLYLVVVPLIMIQATYSGVLLGDQDFYYFNLTRFVPPVTAAVGYSLLLAIGKLTVEWALIANVVSNVLTAALLMRRSNRRHPLSRIDRPLLRKTMSYGIKAHAGSISSFVNARLDLLIIPAFLSAASVGLYSVATNVSSILPVLTGTVALMVLPVAAQRQGSARTVIRTMHATMGIALAIAVPLIVLAPFGLKLIYGGGFDDAATPLRILLPGAVAQAGVTVLWSGLLAAERPFLASAAIAPGAVATVVSLIVFLPMYGIDAAATITTVVYFGELIALATIYRRVLGIRWAHYLRPPAR